MSRKELVSMNSVKLTKKCPERNQKVSVNYVKLTKKCPERNQKVSTSDSSQIEERVRDRGTNQDTHKPNLNKELLNQDTHKPNLNKELLNQDSHKPNLKKELFLMCNQRECVQPNLKKAL